MNDYDQDRGAMIERAVQAGVTRLITIGIDLDTSKRAIELAEQYESVSATIGVHPHHVADLTDDDYGQLRELARNSNVVGFGEIGMDLFKCHAPADLQEIHFRRQLQIAKELKLPVIIHDRDAHDLILVALRETAPFPAGGVMHCFSGDAPLAKEMIELGFYISIPGVVTYNKADNLLETIRQTDLNHLLVETDAPFLSPVPKRGKRNEPAYVLYTAAKVAEIKGISLAEVASRTTANAKRLFNLS